MIYIYIIIKQIYCTVMAPKFNINRAVIIAVLFILTLAILIVGIKVNKLENTHPIPIPSTDLTPYAKSADLINLASAVTALTSSVTKTTKYDLSSYASLQFFGDSITQGYLLPNASTQRWSAIVSTGLRKQEINNGIGGDQVPDAVSNIYANRNVAVPTFLSYGTNDIGRVQYNIDEMKRCILGMLLYCTLPTACVMNPRAPASPTNKISTTGTWSPTDLSNVGIMTNPASNGNYSTNGINATVTAQLTGRYVGFVSVVLNNTNKTNYPQYGINLDGTNLNPFNTYTYMAQTNNGFGLMSYLWLYDTGSTAPNASHTLTIAPKPIGNYTDRGFVDFFVGFDAKQAGCVPSYLVEPADFDYHVFTDNNLIAPLMSSYKEMLEQCTNYLASDLGLPVALIRNLHVNDTGDTFSDLLHPNIAGHQKIAAKILNAIS